jgi:hypothetical protein
MSVYTPQFAPMVVLAFLGTVALVLVCLLAVIVGVLRKSRTMLLGGAVAAILIVAGYTAVLVGLSLFSRNVEIAQGAWKYFCEIDCHIAYAVGGTQFTASVGPEMKSINAHGQFVIVQLKTWFDPTTISPHRGNAPLTPNGREAMLVDESGRRFAPSVRGESVLSAAGLGSTRFGTALRPGESYVSFLVFETPGDVKNLRLLLTTSDRENSFIWGGENSPFHRKAYFALPRS